MRFGVLGSLRALRADGSAPALGGPRLRALLAMLLLDAGRVVTAERLLDGLYEGSAAVNALQSQVSRLRGVLDVAVERRPAGYLLAVDPAEVDVAVFERLVGQGRAAGTAGERAAYFGRALGAWRGPALADVRDAPFASGQVARLEELRLWAVEERVEAELALGRCGELVPELRELVADHPLRERLHGHLMRALYGDGRQGEALAAYEAARVVLADELGTDPSPALSTLHLSILRNTLPPPTSPAALGDASFAWGEGNAALGDAVFAWGEGNATLGDAVFARGEGNAALRDVAFAWGDGNAVRGDAADVRGEGFGVRGGVPAQFTSFVGREGELRALGEVLGRARLVTLVGAGGAGKTRLAIEAVNGEEACFVELGGLAEGADVAAAVLTALGLRTPLLQDSTQRSEGWGVERVVGALRARSLLVVLDNCEHLVAEVAGLAYRLLAACPGVRILATSREALGVIGEVSFPVAPLALPEAGEAPLSGAAVRLFAERAAAVRPGFAVDVGNADDVVRICRALDGLPLAIELAAARLRSLPPAELAARLDDAYALLSRGTRTAEPRHRTLRAVVEWSWDLLDPREQVLARRLSVFAGGAGLAAVERVCDVPDAVGVLAGLAEKSLVELVGDRYRMLGVIRAFCAERLAEAGEEHRLRQAHAEHYHDVLRAAAPHLLRAEQLDRLDRLDADQDNLRAALHWAAGHDVPLGLRLIGELATYWWLRGRRADGVAPARALLAATGDEPPPGLEGEYVLCVLTAALSGPALRPHLERAGRLLTRTNAAELRPQLVFFWSLAAGPADEASREALSARLRDSADPWIAGLSHLGRGVLAQLVAGDLVQAEREYVRAIERFSSIGERWGMMTAYSELADLVGWLGEEERFTALMGEALRLAGELGATEDRAELLCRRADGIVALGDPDRARAGYEEALGLARTVGAVEAGTRARFGLAELDRRAGDHAGARARCLEVLAGDLGSFGGDLTHVRAQVALGWIAADQGDREEAAVRQDRALTRALDVSSRPHLAMAVEGVAGVAALYGDLERATLLLGAARALRGTTVAGDRDVAAVSARAKAGLGEDRYERAYRKGEALNRDELITLARSGLG